LEVAKAECLALNELHLGLETFSDAVVAGEPPHGGDFLAPGDLLSVI
jgi:hypothetical protein